MRGCPQCGRPNCRQHRRKPAPRRRYSDTAEARAVRAEVLERDGLVCAYCQGAIDDTLARGNPGALVMAHVIPHEDGGEFTAENVRPAHSLCNLEAGRAPMEA